MSKSMVRGGEMLTNVDGRLVVGRLRESGIGPPTIYVGPRH